MSTKLLEFSKGRAESLGVSENDVVILHVYKDGKNPRAGWGAARWRLLGSNDNKTWSVIREDLQPGGEPQLFFVKDIDYLKVEVYIKEDMALPDELDKIDEDDFVVFFQ